MDQQKTNEVWLPVPDARFSCKYEVSNFGYVRNKASGHILTPMRSELNTYMPKHSFSFSSMKDFKGCGRRYHAVKVQQLYPFKDTQATIYGKEVHLALEEHIRDGKPLPEGLKHLQGSADAVLGLSGTKYCEHEMAVRPDLTATDFNDEARWIRGIADVLVVDGEKARVLDWKTGSARFPDKDQLELMALLTFAHFPEVKEVKGALVFLNHGKLVKGIYKRENADEMWRKWLSYGEQLDASFEADVWHPNPTPLCRFCPVEHCEYWVR